jgi:hypothetical protein
MMPLCRQAGALFPVQVADADHHDLLGAQLGAGPPQVDQVGVAGAGEYGHRHAVDVARGRRVRRVEVAVRVHPDHAQRAVSAHAADGADGHGVVAAEKDGKLLFAAGRGHVVDRSARLHHRGEVAQPTRARLDPALRAHQVFVASGHRYVARVVHLQPDAQQPVVQPGVAHRARPHVHPAALLPQVHRRADDADALV